MSEDNTKLIGSAFLDFLYVIAKSRKFLILMISMFLIGALIIGLVIPKSYKATSSVVAAEQSDLMSAMGGLSGLAKSFSPLKGLGSLSGGSELDKYMGILKSSSMKRDLIANFNLNKVYKLENEPYWKVEKELSDNLDFQITDDGVLDINVFDENPILAAKMANYLVGKLNEVNTGLHSTNAKAIRGFIEKRYFQNVNDISELEANMKAFQIKQGVIAVPEQIEATIKVMSSLYTDLAKEEIVFNVMKKTIDIKNPAVLNKEIEVQEIKNKINNISSDENKQEQNKVLVTLKNAPQIVGDYLKIYKNLEIQYKIAEFIIPLYEQAKIEEARSTPSVLILDMAYPPERKAKPKILLFMLIGFALSVILGLLMVFTVELMKKLKIVNEEKYSYISNIFKPFTRKVS
jgi:tyrosine-protein kinase Etk/Wzc